MYLKDQNAQLGGVNEIATGKRFLECVQCPFHRAGVVFLW